MSVQLLDKTRKINKLLHNNHSHRVEFNDICEVLSGILESNILVISQKGKILGAASYSGIDKIGELITADTGGFVDNMLNERLLGVLSTKENVNLLTLGFSGGSERKFKALIAPVDIAGERLGTLFIYKCVADYDIDDIILCLGSDIRNGDKQHKTVTTLFQSPVKQKVKMEKRKTGVLLNDHSGMLYAMKDCDPVVQKNDSFTIAYIDHDVAPDRAGYQYYVVTNGDKQLAAHLLSENTPIQILRQDDKAHIVRVKDLPRIFLCQKYKLTILSIVDS